jgi:RimJ/RimL family protein N-acetyltransferase
MDHFATRGVFAPFYQCLSSYAERIIIMELSTRALLRLHVEAVWGVKLPVLEENEVTLLAESSQLNWRLYVADLDGERLMIWRPGLTSLERSVLLTHLAKVQSLPASVSPQEVRREVALSLVAAPRLDPASARQLTRQLGPEDYALLEAFWPGEAARLLQAGPHPLLGVVVEERLLTLAHSSRRTSAACELGIDTLPEARRRGYALAATIAWSASIQAEGLIPIYSAFAENTASLRLAHAAGYRQFARATMLV